MGICRGDPLPKAVDDPSVKSNSITLLSGLQFGKTYGGPEAGGGKRGSMENESIFYHTGPLGQRNGQN